MGRLTPFQVTRILNHPRDEKGEILRPPAEIMPPYEDVLTQEWQQRGLAAWRARQKAREEMDAIKRHNAETLRRFQEQERAGE